MNVQVEAAIIGFLAIVGTAIVSLTIAHGNRKADAKQRDNDRTHDREQRELDRQHDLDRQIVSLESERVHAFLDKRIAAAGEAGQGMLTALRRYAQIRDRPPPKTLAECNDARGEAADAMMLANAGLHRPTLAILFGSGSVVTAYQAAMDAIMRLWVLQEKALIAAHALFTAEEYGHRHHGDAQGTDDWDALNSAASSARQALDDAVLRASELYDGFIGDASEAVNAPTSKVRHP